MTGRGCFCFSSSVKPCSESRLLLGLGLLLFFLNFGQVLGLIEPEQQLHLVHEGLPPFDLDIEEALLEVKLAGEVALEAHDVVSRVLAVHRQ